MTSSLMLTSLTTLICAAAFFTPFYFLYRAAFPRLIPGIPSAYTSQQRIFGDIGDLTKYQAERGEFFSFLLKRCIELNTPICQVYLRAFRRPWVVVADSQEAYNILVRRTPRDFERSQMLGDAFGALTPNFHARMWTNDQWRSNRRLMAESMSWSFLQHAAAPIIHAEFCDLIQLWRSKVALAEDKAFEVEKDVEVAMLEAIFELVFGFSEKIVRANCRDVILSPEARPAAKGNHIAVFRDLTLAEDFVAIRSLLNSQMIAASSPLGMAHHKLVLAIYPSLRTAMKVRKRLFDTGFRRGLRRVTQQEASGDICGSVIDLIIKKETAMAEKENRPPQYDTGTSRDELFGFITGAAGTTAAQFLWVLKLLIHHQDVQQKLRSCFQEAFEDAQSSGHIPTANDVVRSDIPYLDAFVEETFRVKGAAPIVSRTSKRDVDVLGHRVPAGVDVVMVTMGPGYTAPSFRLADNKRWKGDGGVSTIPWLEQCDENSLLTFDPTRWLKTDEQGVLVFDAGAAPQLAMGVGIRGCFGQRLAKLALKVAIVVVMSSFELRDLPTPLAGLEAKDVFTHTPKYAYLMLRDIHRTYMTEA